VSVGVLREADQSNEGGSKPAPRTPTTFVQTKWSFSGWPRAPRLPTVSAWGPRSTSRPAAPSHPPWSTASRANTRCSCTGTTKSRTASIRRVHAPASREPPH